MSKFSNNIFTNIIHLTRLFFIKPVPNVRVCLTWGGQKIYTHTASDGFFKLEWQSAHSVAAGWHDVVVDLLNQQNAAVASGKGKIFVPHPTQYGFISDIDDTVLVSHSANTRKKLRVLFTKNPRSRKTFADVVKFYNLLAFAHTEPILPNPFFYVSSSEWNLYDNLNAFFKHNGLPKGAFLLNQIKRWHQLLKTGGTKHQGKLNRIVRIIDAFPKQRFVLLGDNSQADPEIYADIVNTYPGKIVAIYIRNITHKKESATTVLLESLQSKGVQTCHFKHTDQAILHARAIGLIG